MRALAAVALVFALLAPGCVSSDAPAATSECPATPQDASWRTWWLSAADVMPPPPPRADEAAELAELRALAAKRNETTRALTAGDEPVGAAWSRAYLAEAFARADDGKGNPPRQARQMAMLETAMFDALALAREVRPCFGRAAPSLAHADFAAQVEPRAAMSYPNEDAAVHAAAAVMLDSFFPDADEGWRTLARERGDALLVAGVARRSDVDAGRALGEAVAEAVLRARADDGSEAPLAAPGPRGTCQWEPTPPRFGGPTEPNWGAVTPFVLKRGGAHRPGPPPACDGESYFAQARSLYDASFNLSESERAAALRWSGSPPLSWYELALDASADAGLDDLAHARLMAHTSVALADAGIAAWDAKFTYWSDRPVLTIRKHWDAEWTPLVETPPFPGYVSGHSTFSGAASTVLGALLPERAAAFDALAHEAMLSRFWGGIHIMADNTEGLELGRHVGADVLARGGLAPVDARAPSQP